MIRSYKYRLYPNGAQEAALSDMPGHFCDLYNAGLQQRIEAWNRQGVSLGYAAQAGELRAVRDAVPELAGYSFSAEQQVLRRLDKAFAAFFRRVKAGETPGFPRFRAKSRFHSADFRVGDGLVCRDGRLRLVGIPGLVKVRWHRELPARPSHAIVSRSNGKWYVTLQLNSSSKCSFQSRVWPDWPILAHVFVMEWFFSRFLDPSRSAVAILPCTRAGLPWPGTPFSVPA